jgi:hypothetical protein
MSTVKAIRGWSDFSVTEWNRLSGIADKYEPKMRTAYLRAVRSGNSVDKLQLRKVITDIVVETGITSAGIYDLVFNPNSGVYIDTIDSLTEKFASSVNSPKAQDAVRRILPSGITLPDRRRRLNTFGLDARSAVRVETYRQQRGDSPTALSDVERVRRSAVVERGNLLAITETNRMVNTALETLWLDNSDISKAEVLFYDRSIRDINKIPKRARKEWITRRDDAVCNYCFPLEGNLAKIGEEFDTDYGWFECPPIHPRCRCFMILFDPRG